MDIIFSCPIRDLAPPWIGVCTQPSTQAFPSRSLDLARNFIPAATQTGSQALARTLCSPVRGRERNGTRLA